MSYIEQRRRFLGRCFRLIGRDGNTIQFQTPSWTSKDLFYEVWVDFDSGEISCSCSGARRWKLHGDIYNGGGCKHAQGIAALIGEHLSRNGIEV